MDDSAMKDLPIDAFTLGFPKLVCRWRLYNRCLPMENRHLRALSARQLEGGLVSPALVAWAKQHLEWTLQDAAVAHPDGVLMLVMDAEGKAAMSLGPYTPLEKTSINHLIDRAYGGIKEARETGVSPEDLWAVQGNTFIWGTSSDYTASGSSSLVVDLVRTLGMTIRRDENLINTLGVARSTIDEVFLVSDEHGIVPASDKGGTHAKRLLENYQKLLKSMRVR